MSNQTFDEACKLVASDIADLVIRKQHDYGHGNILAFGEFGVLVRASDKFERLKNLQGKEAKNEAIDDTWMDVAGYAILALMLRRGVFTLPLEPEALVEI
jgi:hypothetical protein